LTLRGIHGTPVTATQIVHEINTIFVTSDTCVVVGAVAIVVVAGGMITTIMIVSDIATGTGTPLRVQDAVARAVRADMKNDETYGRIVHPAVI
jgi:hypothetical protein